ncbi:hypothetical protein RchiOBHm_Chr1g0354381 [Rosa chinensis]|uniref:Transmembrane protein n=1 Tax=Rosa chinensis TaxID=74649 RepID=A0A2P6SH30_ROSCH|nr:hypothetical protein RchiOBHm_Chr1g0354381 [Rosa chinensis]
MGFSQQYSYIVVLLVGIVICGLSLVCLVSRVLTLEEPERGLRIVKLTHVDVLKKTVAVHHIQQQMKLPLTQKRTSK